MVGWSVALSPAIHQSIHPSLQNLHAEPEEEGEKKAGRMEPEMATKRVQWASVEDNQIKDNQNPGSCDTSSSPAGHFPLSSLRSGAIGFVVVLPTEALLIPPTPFQIGPGRFSGVSISLPRLSIQYSLSLCLTGSICVGSGSGSGDRSGDGMACHWEKYLTLPPYHLTT